MNILFLPDDCLLAVTSLLPILDRVRLRSTCRRLNQLHPVPHEQQNSLTLLLSSFPTAVQALARIRRSQLSIPYFYMLTFPDDSPVHTHQNQNHLHLPQLSRKVIQSQFGSLPTVLPNISNLVVSTFCNDVDSVVHFTFLLESWSHHLRCLKLHLSSFSFVGDYFPNLIHSINSLQSLRHLTIDITFAPPNQVNMGPILGQLEEFHFTCSGATDFLLKNTLHQFGEPSHRLKSIGLASSQEQTEFNIITEHYLKLDPLFASKFTQFYFPNPSLEQLTQFCSLFRFLRFLRIQVILYPHSLCSIVSSLSNLHQLTYLDLHLKFTDKCDPNHLPQSDSIPSYSFVSLPSLLNLTLTFSFHFSHTPETISHCSFTSRHFGHIFENLQILTLNYDYFHCSICQVRHSWVWINWSCIEKVLQPWADQCLRLKRIYSEGKVKGKLYEWTVRPLERLT